MKKTEQLSDAEQIRIFNKVYENLKFRIKRRNTPESIRWLSEHNISIEIADACLSSFQIHWKNNALKEELINIGFLTKSYIQRRPGQPSYAVFGRNGICFPLRNEKYAVINFCAIDLKNGETTYLNDEGIYPKYPEPSTEKLFIVPTTLDAATILESKLLKKKEAVIALFDGKLKQQHIHAVTSLKQLKTIVWISNKNLTQSKNNAI